MRIVVQRVASRQRRRGTVMQLQVSPFGAMLCIEQTDVRRVLLADLPFAPAPGARSRMQTQDRFSTIPLPWLI
jgi:hypothetical protein